MSFTCKHCGHIFPSLLSMSNGGLCYKSPTLSHEAFEGRPSKIYKCKYCGHTFPSILSLVLGGLCYKSPTKKHEAYEGW